MLSCFNAQQHTHGHTLVDLSIVGEILTIYLSYFETQAELANLPNLPNSFQKN